MINIEIISLGKARDAALEELEERYFKRLKSEAKVKITEIVVKGHENLSVVERISKEHDALVPHLGQQRYVVVLDENGKQMTSESFSGLLQKQLNHGISSFLFVIGGVYGLDARIRKQANLELALSSFTFTARIARFILVEQLYRAIEIMNGRPYHKE